MNDELERGLARFRPAALPEELKRRLMTEPLTFGDRVLVTFSGIGALAACVIVAVGVVQAMVTMPRVLSSQEITTQQQMVTEYYSMLAAR